ncbi:hypothetical protein DBT_0958 [Dissulfuribacter thermophilus]|uniref:Uncharacterized protein n=1 Tax=Dissulfuribacter thermophilus TaxID=1156395 RepID=A0A1B9F6P2_9BACT|nr:hypothetical protein [Dissulfuribacter thermophilus]OCC15607.1 hypothetical protein DBT_0958 [Dissulfuribacter thermophilus]
MQPNWAAIVSILDQRASGISTQKGLTKLTGSPGIARGPLVPMLPLFLISLKNLRTT